MERDHSGAMQLCWSEILTVAYWVVGSWILSIALLSALKLMCLWITNALATKFYFSWFASLCSNWDQCLHTPYSIIWLNVLGSSDKCLLTHLRCVVAGHVYYWTAHHQTQSKEVTNHGTNHESHAWCHSTSSLPVTLMCSVVLGPFYPPFFWSVLIIF